MLDDQKYIAQKDPQDALGVATHEPEQLLDKFEIINKSNRPISNIVIAGMGGSALSAEFINTWPGVSVPYEICRSYEIPAYTSENTLFIASSYSGNTEETISAFELARKKNAQIVCVASGGKLKELADSNSFPFVKLRDGFQPRMAALASYKALVSVLAAYNLIPKESTQELESCTDRLLETTNSWRADVHTNKNLAKQLAEQLVGKTPVVYAGPKMFPAAYKWKISFNENSKNIAFCNKLPEFNHNEFLGWTSHPIEKPFGVIDLFSSLENERVKFRFDISDRMLSGMRPKAIRVEAKGNTELEHLLWLVGLGEFVSIYLALLNGVNPTPVDIIEKFKTKLNR